jgi:tetratricopeptide (TPR) repeat protein
MRASDLLVVVAAGALFATSPLAAQPADIESWTTVRSEHFEMYSDADPLRAVEIVASLERFRSVFADLAQEIELRSPAPTRMFAFRDADSYAPYMSGAEGVGVKVLGQFLSHADGNYITLNADPSFLGSFTVILHEYVHFLVQSNFPSVPMWFNEGLAEYYSTFLTEGETAYLGQPVERHMRWLRSNAELGVADVLQATRQSISDHDAQGAGRFYAVSWLLVHYLLSGESDRSAELASYFSSLAQGEEVRGAFIDAFGMRPAELEEALRAYLAESSLRVAALPLAGLPDARGVDASAADPTTVLTALGDLLAHMGREEEAAQHLHRALEYTPDSADAWAVLAYVRDRQQRLEEAHQMWAAAIDLGPRLASSYLLHGRHLMTLSEGGGLTGDGSDRAALAAAARATLRIATELDPSYGEAWAMRGVADLLAGGSVDEGIAHTLRARELLPGRSDILLHLVQLYVRAGRDSEARAIAEGELSRIAAPDEVAAAHEEIERWGLVRSANEALRAGDYETGLVLFDEAISVTSDPYLRQQMEERLATLRRSFEGAE